MLLEVVQAGGGRNDDLRAWKAVVPCSSSSGSGMGTMNMPTLTQT